MADVLMIQSAWRLECASDFGIEVCVQEIVVGVREAKGCAEQRLSSRTISRVTEVLLAHLPPNVQYLWIKLTQ